LKRSFILARALTPFTKNKNYSEIIADLEKILGNELAVK
jgi:hypothetical protein